MWYVIINTMLAVEERMQLCRAEVCERANELSRHRCLLKRRNPRSLPPVLPLNSMARSQSLLSSEPTNVVPQPVTICHVFVSFQPTIPTRSSHAFLTAGN